MIAIYGLLKGHASPVSLYAKKYTECGKICKICGIYANLCICSI